MTMIKNIAYSASLIAAIFMTTPAQAVTAKVVKKEVTIDNNCRYGGGFACAIETVTIETPAPVNSIDFDTSPARGLMGKYKNIAVIKVILISNTRRNMKSSINIHDNDTILHYCGSDQGPTIIFKGSDTGGKTWYPISSPSQNVGGLFDRDCF